MKEQLFSIYNKIEPIITKLLVVGMAVVAPIKSVVISLLVMTLLDCFTGIWAAKKQGIVLSSARFRDTITKMGIYIVVVLAAFLLEKFILADTFPVSQIAAGMAGSVELASIAENANIITGTNIFKKLIDKLGSSNKE